MNPRKHTGRGIIRNTGTTPAERRAYWFDQLSPEEQRHVELLERSIASQEKILADHVRELRAQISKLKTERGLLVNKGNGRARYAVAGRQEWLDATPTSRRRISKHNPEGNQ